jgi:hypothetical protein
MIDRQWRKFKFGHFFKGYQAQKVTHRLVFLTTQRTTPHHATRPLLEKGRGDGAGDVRGTGAGSGEGGTSHTSLMSSLRDEWLLVSGLGLGKTRDLALGKRYEAHATQSGGTAVPYGYVSFHGCVL